MTTGAAPVAVRIRTAVARVPFAGVALLLVFASCHPSRPSAPPVDAAGRAPGAPDTTAVVPPPRGKQIVIAYSSNILGEYEPCG